VSRRSLVTSRQQGFSLLELQVGLLVMTLVVVGFNNLAKAQEGLLRDLEAWCRGDPVLYVAAPADVYERVAGVPATLTGDVPAPVPARAAARQRIVVTKVTHRLHTPRARAYVRVEGKR